jgi:hypothetical protein
VLGRTTVSTPSYLGRRAPRATSITSTGGLRRGRPRDALQLNHQRREIEIGGLEIDSSISAGIDVEILAQMFTHQILRIAMTDATNGTACPPAGPTSHR